MTEWRMNKEGMLEEYNDGVKIGEVWTMGDAFATPKDTEKPTAPNYVIPKDFDFGKEE